MRTVQEAARLTGVSVRTLHYYDEIGLLKPSAVTQAGYRLYDEEALGRLRQILFFRELKFSLREIDSMLSQPGFDAQEALTAQRALLTMERERLDRLVGLIDRLLKGDDTMDFTPFDQTEIEHAREQYAQEAKARWGDTDAYKQAQRRTARYEKEDWARIQQEGDDILRQLALLRELGPEHPAVQALVRAWQAYITRYFYACTDEILAGLGEMYLADERFTRNLDQYGAGTAAFLSEAIRCTCKGAGETQP